MFLVEYAGPLFMTLILLCCQDLIYDQEFELKFNQKLGALMMVLHYAKREYETIFIHRFSNDTMPFFNIFKNSTHYWFLCGFMNMYFFLHPQYTEPAWGSDNVYIALFCLFCFFEFMNLMCHITLKNLRPPGTRVRNIPHGWGFGYVSCANYFWESCAWFTFAILSQVFGAYLFWLVSTLQMVQWAFKKHKAYRKDFKNYPRRKAMFP